MGITVLEFEKKVYEQIERLLSSDETVYYSYEQNIRIIGRVSYDFLLPNGCRAINIPPNSMVEVKLNISSNTINFILSNYRKLQALDHTYTYVVIYGGEELNASFDEKDFPNLILINFNKIEKEHRISEESMPNIYEGNKNRVKQESNNEHSENSQFKNSEIDSDSSVKENQSSIQNQKSSGQEIWMTQSKNNLLDLKQCLIDNRCSFVLGAGVSMDAKVPSWGQLLVKLIMHRWKCSNVDAKKRFDKLLDDNNSSYLIVARIILKDIPYQEQIEVMHNALYENTEDSKLINTLCQTIKSREVDSIITFNYDILLEEGLEKIKLKTTSISEKDIQIKDYVPIYHVHGIIPRSLKPDEHTHSLSYITPVLTEHDYHELYGDIYSWSNILTLNTLNHNTCVLIGLSMTDPNLRRMLDISYKNKGEDKFHYVFMGYANNKLLEYDRIRGELLEELGLKVIWYRVKNKGKDHSELVKLLKELQ